MKTNHFIQFLALLFMFILLFSCDEEKYFSFSLNSQQGKDSTTVTGTVLRHDNNKPVDSAIVQIGYNLAITDSFGFFRLGIRSSSDDNRNDYAPVVIKALNYLDYYGKTLILPTTHEFHFKIFWRIPIVEAAVLLYNPVEGVEKIIQARVKDFEGVDDIDKVYTILRFAKITYPDGSVAKPSEFLYIYLKKVYQVDSLTAIFQSERFDRTILHPQNVIPFFIFVEDKHGFHDSIRFDYRYNNPSPLYPVNWE